MLVHLDHEDSEIWLLRIELEQMERFLDLLHTSINDRKGQFNASIEEQARTMPEEQRQEFYEAHADDYMELDADFPRLFLSSFVVSWYSFMENYLTGFCRRRMPKSKAKKTYGWTIQKSFNFLEDLAGHELDTEPWDKLNRIRQVRNIIVHRRGSIHYSPHDDAFPEKESTTVKLDGEVQVYLQIEEDLYEYLKTNKLFEPKGLFYITPTPEYCKNLVNYGKEFFLKLHKDFPYKRPGK